MRAHRGRDAGALQVIFGPGCGCANTERYADALRCEPPDFGSSIREEFPVSREQTGVCGIHMEVVVNLTDPTGANVELVREAAASLLRIWREVLSEFHPDSGTLRVDLDTDIFEAGATSLLVMMFISRIYDEFGVEVPFDAVLQRPTIGGLGRRLVERMAQHVASPDSP